MIIMEQLFSSFRSVGIKNTKGEGFTTGILNIMEKMYPGMVMSAHEDDAPLDRAVLNVFGVVFFRIAETLQNLAKTGVPRIGIFSVVVSHRHTSLPKFNFLYEMLNRFAFITISD